MSQDNNGFPNSFENIIDIKAANFMLLDTNIENLWARKYLQFYVENFASLNLSSGIEML